MVYRTKYEYDGLLNTCTSHGIALPTGSRRFQERKNYVQHMYLSLCLSHSS
jgi:hypothetical protein